MHRETEYRLIVESSPEALSERVNRHTQDGWDLWGSPAMTSEQGGFAFAQAVTLTREEATPGNLERLTEQIIGKETTP